jgi:hypothetical protein
VLIKIEFDMLACVFFCLLSLNALLVSLLCLCLCERGEGNEESHFWISSCLRNWKGFLLSLMENKLRVDVI